MLWIFERKGEQMRCEIRREGVGAGYEMIVTTPDGSQRMERFDETNDLIKRTLDLQRELVGTVHTEEFMAAVRRMSDDPYQVDEAHGLGVGDGPPTGDVGALGV